MNVITYFYNIKILKLLIHTWTDNVALKPIFKKPCESFEKIRINDCLKIAVVKESDKII